MSGAAAQRDPIFHADNSFTYDEDGEVLIELTVRERAALFAQELVVWVDSAQKLIKDWDGAPPHPRLAFRAALVAKLAEAALVLNCLRYTCRLLEYHISIIFSKNPAQTRITLTKQIILAVHGAVESVGAGRLKPVQRQWDVVWDDMKWSEAAVGEFSEAQRNYTFRIVIRFYRVNVEANRFCKDCFGYMCVSDKHGMGLFGGDVIMFSDCLRVTHGEFTLTAQRLLRDRRCDAVMAERTMWRGGGDSDAEEGGESDTGWTSWAFYVFSALFLSVIVDSRLFTLEKAERESWLGMWKYEGHIVDGGQLRLLVSEFIPVAKAVQRTLSLQLRETRDALAGKSKSEVVDIAVKVSGEAFVQIVMKLAPVGLRAAIGNYDKSKVTTSPVVLIYFRRIVTGLWNTRVKMLRSIDVDGQVSSRTQSFRGAISAQEGSAIQNRGESVKCKIEKT